MPFLLRPAVPDDVEAIASVNLTAWREAYAHILSAQFLAELTVGDRVERWRRSIELGEQRTFVCEVDGEVRGYAAAGPPRSEEKPRDLELYMLYQLASEHGTGSGQALLDAVLGDAPAFLWVAERNPRALAFYRRNGFEPDGAREVDAHFEGMAEIRMVR